MRKRKWTRRYHGGARTVGRMLRGLRRDFRPDLFAQLQEITWADKSKYEAASGRKII